MGNLLSFDNFTTFNSNPFKITIYNNCPNYILKISIDELRETNLDIIENKLNKLYAPLITSKLQKIMFALRYILKNEKFNVISRLDYYLFSNNHLPILEIKCLNAKKKQLDDKIESNKYHCAICDLDKI